MTATSARNDKKAIGLSFLQMGAISLAKLPTLLDVKCRVLFHTLLHVLGSRCSKFETGQNFSVQTDATAPQNIGNCWPAMLRPFSRASIGKTITVCACITPLHISLLSLHDYDIKMFKRSTI